MFNVLTYVTMMAPKPAVFWIIYDPLCVPRHVLPPTFLVMTISASRLIHGESLQWTWTFKNRDTLHDLLAHIVKTLLFTPKI
jgi:hypothetical protein